MTHAFLCLPFCLIRSYSVPFASISLSCVPSGPPSLLQIHHHVYQCSAKSYSLDMPCSHVVTAFRLSIKNRAVNCLGNPKNDSPCPISTIQCDLKLPRHFETCPLLGCDTVNRLGNPKNNSLCSISTVQHDPTLLRHLKHVVPFVVTRLVCQYYRNSPNGYWVTNTVLYATLHLPRKGNRE
jgi:hypothetical protein